MFSVTEELQKGYLADSGFHFSVPNLWKVIFFLLLWTTLSKIKLLFTGLLVHGQKIKI